MTTILRDLIGYRAMLQNLLHRDLKLKYRCSTLGIAWSLLNPLLMAAVYTFAFKFVMRIEMASYPCFPLAGLLPWSFFSGSLLASTHTITGNERP